MKKIIFISLLLAVGLFSGAKEAPKYGYVSFSDVAALVPGVEEAASVIDKEKKEMQSIINEKQSGLNQMVTSYNEKKGTLSDVVKKAMEEDIKKTEAGIQETINSMNELLSKRRSELVDPINKQAQEVIDEVAKENGIICVFDSGALLYKSDELLDLLPLVKEKLTPKE